MTGDEEDPLVYRKGLNLPVDHVRLCARRVPYVDGTGELDRRCLGDVGDHAVRSGHLVPLRHHLCDEVVVLVGVEPLVVPHSDALVGAKPVGRLGWTITGRKPCCRTATWP